MKITEDKESSKELFITKSTGDKAKFSKSKLVRSLKNSGADDKTVKDVLDVVRDKVYQGMSSKEIYELCNSILKKKANPVSMRYQLKAALMELGPEGYPFEKFIKIIFEKEGYTAKNSVVLQGDCISHEIDVLASKGDELLAVECKFHSDPGRTTRVKTPLYIHSRFNDLVANLKSKTQPTSAYIVTNTRFTIDAEQYAKCYGIRLLSWDFPKRNALKDKIDRFKLFPITVSNQLTSREKELIINANCLHCSDLLNRTELLESIGIKGERLNRIIQEMESLLK